MKELVNEKSIPLVNISVDIDKVTKPDYTPASIEITDPQKRTDGNLVATFKCKVKYRGATSLQYEKKSFAVKLLDEKGKSLNATILGIRSDDAWILDAMAIDRIRMRNRINFDVWNAMSVTPYTTDYENRNGTKGFFVELFLNGKYHGLYCMSDKVNRKLLGLKKANDKDKANVTINGVMYKCDTWGSSAELWGYDEQEMTGEMWNSWSLEYPDDYPCEEAYMPLKEFIDFCGSTDEDFSAGINKELYLQSFLDYHVFILSQGLRDCNMKNSFLSIVDKNTDRRMLLTPWDLDCSLGGDWDGQYHDELADNETLLSCRLYYRLWNMDVDGYKAKVADRWRTLCNGGILSTEAFNKRVDDYTGLLMASGAWKREYEKWNGNPVELKQDLHDEADYVKDWYSRNFNNLNELVFRGIGLDGIKTVTCNNQNSGQWIFNVMGQQVGKDFKGIVVKNRRKFVVR